MLVFYDQLFRLFEFFSWGAPPLPTGEGVDVKQVMR